MTSHPFPLAVHSSRHSSYHRFLLGADPDLLAPFPKPDCIGTLAADLPELTTQLNLAKWRKLFNASFPWRDGFAPVHYALNNVAPHRPLPIAYGRPSRKFGAFDFVRVADPAVSALALVGGDDRVLKTFLGLNDSYCRTLEEAAACRHPDASGERRTGRLLVGRFAEPNNRWLMPMLHAHNRVLNFTSRAQAPAMLHCIDPEPLILASRRSRSAGAAADLAALRSLGYEAYPPTESSCGIRVEGVSEALLTAIEAPRIAVLRLMERLLGENGGGWVLEPGGRAAATAVAALAQRLESRVAQSVVAYPPPKISLPTEGPWRTAVRSGLRAVCAAGIDSIDAAVVQARRCTGISNRPAFPPNHSSASTMIASILDEAHVHGVALDGLLARDQDPTDSDLIADFPRVPPDDPCLWLAAEFEATLLEVRSNLSRGGREDLYAASRLTWYGWDRRDGEPDLAELRSADRILLERIERRPRQFLPPSFSPSLTLAPEGKTRSMEGIHR